MANRYRTKNTQGLQGQFFVSSVAEPADADFENFVTSGSEGEFSFFNAAGTRYAGSGTPGNAANIQPGDKFFAAQKIDGKIKRSQLLDASNCTVSSKAYAAGSKHKIVWTGFSDPTVGDDLSISVIETTPTQEPFPTWFYDHTATTTDFYAQAVLMIAKINDASNKANESDGRFVNADVLTSTAGTVFPTAGTATVTNGSTTVTTSQAHTIDVNDWIQLEGSLYQALTGTTGTTIILDRPYAGATGVVSNANTGDIGTKPATSTMSFELEAININEHFTAAIPTSWDEDGVTATVTPFTKSSGTPAQVLDFESEGNIWEGYRTGNRAFGEEFGVPTSQVDTVTNNTYDIYTIKYKTTQKSVMAPIAEDSHVSYVNFAVSESGVKTYMGQVLGDI